MKPVIDPRFEPLLRAIGGEAARAGLEAYAVGGCVRDWALGRSTADIDIMCGGDCSPLARFCAEKYGAETESFGRFCTCRAKFPDGLKLDFARSRRETYSRPAALPDVSPAEPREDLVRRDFSANAAAISLSPDSFGELLDPHCAMCAIGAGMLRVLHDRSFIDDPTRLFRAVRFASRFGWTLDPRTGKLFFEAVRDKLPSLLSRERIRTELLKILSESEPARAFALLEGSGLVNFIWKGLVWNEAASFAGTACERLAVLAAGRGPEAGEFLKSLKLERTVSRELLGALAVAESGLSPDKGLTESQKRIIRAIRPNLPEAALHPLFVSGADVLAAGFGGKDVARMLKEMARRQFAGEIPDRPAALAALAAARRPPSAS